MSFLPWLSQAMLCPCVSLPKSKPGSPSPSDHITTGPESTLWNLCPDMYSSRAWIWGCAQSLSCIQFFVTPWTVAHQATWDFPASIREWVATSFSMLPVVQLVKNLPAMQFRFLGWEYTLEKGQVTYSSILGLPHSSRIAWRIPWTEEPGRLHTVLGVAKSQTPLSNFHFLWLINRRDGVSLVLQWLRLQTSKTGGLSSIPGQGTKIPHVVWCKQKVKIKK